MKCSDFSGPTELPTDISSQPLEVKSIGWIIAFIILIIATLIIAYLIFCDASYSLNSEFVIIAASAIWITSAIAVACLRSGASCPSTDCSSRLVGAALPDVKQTGPAMGEPRPREVRVDQAVGVSRPAAKPASPKVGASSPREVEVSQSLGAPCPPRRPGSQQQGRDTSLAWTRATLKVETDDEFRSESVPRELHIGQDTIANAVFFLLTQTEPENGARLWAIDAFHAYQNWAKLCGATAGSFENLRRAATALGWERGKSNTRYYKDRSLK